MPFTKINWAFMKESTSYYETGLLRTCLLPYDRTIENLYNVTSLKSYWDNPIFRKGIYIASTTFFNELSNFFLAPNWEGEKSEKIILSLVKYILRATFKPTPFGLFSGYTVFNTSDKTEVFFNDESRFVYHYDLDNDIIERIISDNLSVLQNDLSIKYFPNNTIYKVNSGLRYIRSNTSKSKFKVSRIMKYSISYC